MNTVGSLHEHFVFAGVRIPMKHSRAIFNHHRLGIGLLFTKVLGPEQNLLPSKSAFGVASGCRKQMSPHPSD